MYCTVLKKVHVLKMYLDYTNFFFGPFDFELNKFNCKINNNDDENDSNNTRNNITM